MGEGIPSGYARFDEKFSFGSTRSREATSSRISTVDAPSGRIYKVYDVFELIEAKKPSSESFSWSRARSGDVMRHGVRELLAERTGASFGFSGDTREVTEHPTAR